MGMEWAWNGHEMGMEWAFCINGIAIMLLSGTRKENENRFYSEFPAKGTMKSRETADIVCSHKAQALDQRILGNTVENSRFI
jgi:hypothetical protein